MRPGDVFCGNDAYEGGGTHLPDIVLAEPVFVDGEMTFWAVNLAHHADFADRGHAHIYQEGLRIPPIRLYRAGELQTDVQELILLNCQVPRERLSDFRAQMAANRLGRRAARCIMREIRARCRARRWGRAAGLRGAKDAGRYRVDPRWNLQFRRQIRLPGDRRRVRCLLRDQSPRRFDASAFRRTAANSRWAQHDLHSVAFDGLLRGESDRGPDHSTERRPRASVACDRAGRHRGELRASRRGEWPPQPVSAGRGLDLWRIGPGRSG